MSHPLIRQSLALLAGAATAALLASCETTGVARHLPAYEPPIAKAQFQTARTTAYTHTESDHLQYTNHNALGGELHAAGPPIHRAESGTRGLSLGLEEQADYRVASYTGAPQPFSIDEDADRPAPKTKAAKSTRTTTVKAVAITRGAKRAVAVIKTPPPKIGSAAADWARWPAGTTFRLLSTGQIYRVDDYGWALAGRNTIDLYMANPTDMNSWGTREEQIQVLTWGDPQESLKYLRPHQSYKHIRRMVMELEGREQEAAALQ